jgi:hypothetical protein
MVIMSFNSDSKDYFNQRTTKKLMSKEESNKATSPEFCLGLSSFRSSGANHELVKGPGVGQRSGLTGFPCGSFENKLLVSLANLT